MSWNVSGGHTIGIAHCSSFDKRLYNNTTGQTIVDPTLDVSFRQQLLPGPAEQRNALYLRPNSVLEFRRYWRHCG